MKFAKIIILILVLSLVLPTPVNGQSAQAVGSDAPLPQNPGLAQVHVISASPTQVVTLVRNPRVLAPCASAADNSLLQGSVGINLFVESESCFSGKVAEFSPNARNITVQSPPARPTEITINNIPATFQNDFAISSVPEARPIAPVPLLMFAVAAALYEFRKSKSWSDKQQGSQKLFGALSLERLQVYRC